MKIGKNTSHAYLKNITGSNLVFYGESDALLIFWPRNDIEHLY